MHSKTFERQGYLGPFTVLEPEEVAELRRNMVGESIRYRDRSPYPPANKVLLDQYLYLPSLVKLATHPVIIERLRAILGDDLLCWRTSWFRKLPGDPGSDWHQAEQFHEFTGVPKLTPTTARDVYVVSAWVAFTPCTIENGCLQFVPGSHRTWYYDESVPQPFVNQAPKLKDGELRSFYGYDADKGLLREPGWTPPREDIVDVLMEPGQAVLFTERVLHGSRPNISASAIRLALSIRYVSADVKVYEGVESHSFFGETFPTDRHRCLVVSGEPTYAGNRVVYPGELVEG